MSRRAISIVATASLAAAFCLAFDGASAQPRRVCILMPYRETDSVVQARVAAFQTKMARLGWIRGQSVTYEERWTSDDMAQIRSASGAIVQSDCEVILTTGSRVLPVLKKLTDSIPIVFAGNSDPVGQGIVASLARPLGNITGFSLLELANGRSPIMGELLEFAMLLKPTLSRVGIMFNPDNPAAAFHRASFVDFAGKFQLQPLMIPVRTSDDIVSSIRTFAEDGGGAIILPSDLTLLQHRNIVVREMNKLQIIAVYSDESFVAVGGLISYSADRADLFRRAATYVHRILHGAKPAFLPVQQPERYFLSVNIRTARQSNIAFPPEILLRADDVIE